MTLKQRFGRLLRMPLGLIPPTVVVPVVSGPGRGMRWVVGSTPHGAWLGTLERDKLARFMARLRPGMTVWDIGANVGLYTLPSARAVAPAGCVVAFEPMPRNLRFLRRHLALNGLGGVVVCEAAVSDRAGTLRMKEGDSPSEFHADPGGDREVRAITLDEWLSENGALPPDVVKIDVEDSDDAVLRGGARLLAGWGYKVTSLEPGRGPEVSSEWLAEPL